MFLCLTLCCFVLLFCFPFFFPSFVSFSVSFLLFIKCVCGLRGMGCGISVVCYVEGTNEVKFCFLGLFAATQLALQ